MPFSFVYLSLCFGGIAGISAAAAWRFLPARWLWSDAPQQSYHPHALHFRSFFWAAAVSAFFAVLFFLLTQQAAACPQSAIRLVFPAAWHDPQPSAAITSASTSAQTLSAQMLSPVLWSCLLLWLLFQSAVADVCYRLLPDQWTAGIALLGAGRLFMLLCCGQAVPAADAVLQLLLPTLIALQLGLFCCALLYALPLMVRGTPAIGFGDVKLLLALAAALPPATALRLFLVASLFSGGAAIALLFVRRLKSEDGLPFAPFLAVAALWVFLC